MLLRIVMRINRCRIEPLLMLLAPIDHPVRVSGLLPDLKLPCCLLILTDSTILFLTDSFNQEGMTTTTQAYCCTNRVWQVFVRTHLAPDVYKIAQLCLVVGLTRSGTEGAWTTFQACFLGQTALLSVRCINSPTLSAFLHNDLFLRSSVRSQMRESSIEVIRTIQLHPNVVNGTQRSSSLLPGEPWNQ